MFKYFSSYFISIQMLNKVANIMEKLGRLSNIEDLSKMPYLQNDNIVKIIQSSLALENIELTLEEVKNIINNDLNSNDENKLKKVKDLFSLYYSGKEFDLYEINELKRANSTLGSTENFRRTNEMQMVGKRCFVLAPPPELVENLIKELIEFAKTNDNTVHPLIIASIFHYKIAYINPFENNNMIMARFCQNAILSKWKKIFKYLPVEEKILKYKDEYKKAIDQSNQSGSFNDFIEFMLKVIDESLEDLLEDVINQVTPVTTSISKLLSIMEINVPISANEIMERLSIKSKETLRGTYLKPAMQAGLVVALLPDKPTSKKQMYYKVK